MLIGATQTQSLYASVKISGTIADVREAVPRRAGAGVGDLLDVRNHVDEGYASTVLQNAMRDRLQAAMATAKAAVEEHQQWLESELLPNAGGDFRLGAELYDQQLAFTLKTPLTRSQVRQRSEHDMVRVRDQM